MHQISDKAEVAIDFPDKFYMGGFGRDSEFEARAEADGMLIRLVRPGTEKRKVEIHLHYFLLASILEEFAQSVAAQRSIDELHRQPLIKSVRALEAALEKEATPSPK
jgi:hypothetical protein